MSIELCNKCIGPLIMEGWGNIKANGPTLYKEVEMISYQYLTTPEAMLPLLPDCFQPALQPVVTVAFLYYKGVDFMAGRGYRVATMTVRVCHKSKNGILEGDYPLVMFEDETIPIMLGRELIGFHKIYGDISPINTLPGERFRCEVSYWGHLLFGLEVGPLAVQDSAVVAQLNQSPVPPMFGFKYIPSLDAEPDVAYPISTPTENTFEKLAAGNTGELFFGDATKTEISWYASIVDALKTLPVVQVEGVMKTFGSMVIRGDLSRKLL